MDLQSSSSYKHLIQFKTTWHFQISVIVDAQCSFHAKSIRSTVIEFYSNIRIAAKSPRKIAYYFILNSLV